MRVKKFTNADVVARLSNCSSRDDISKRYGNELIRGLSFIPLSVTSRYKKFSNYQDLVQVAYETLWKSIISFDINKSDNFYYWAFLWTRQSVAQAALKEKIYLEATSCSGLNLDVNGHTDFEKELLEIEDSALMKKSIAELSPSQSYVMNEVYQENKSLRDIGIAMSLSHESVRKIRDDATRRLKMIIDQKIVINTCAYLSNE